MPRLVIDSSYWSLYFLDVMVYVKEVPAATEGVN